MCNQKSKRVFNIAFSVFTVLLMIILVCEFVAASHATKADDIWGTNLNWTIGVTYFLTLILAEAGIYFSSRYLLFGSERRSANMIWHAVMLIVSVLVFGIDLLVFVLFR